LTVDGYTLHQKGQDIQMAKILLVEDDMLTRQMYDKTFAVAGFEVETAENGQEGLEKLKKYTPNVILLDINMPVMNGIEMLTKLKADAATRDIPVIIMTNVTDLKTNEEAFSKGANLTIVKSETEPDEVIDWINTVLAKFSQNNEQH
jgi:CheY-like chemotaxis protein